MNIFNKKTILFFSISTLMINGCVAKKEFKPHSPTHIMFSANKVQSKNLQSKNLWKKVIASSTKKEDCIDCYAAPIASFRPASFSNNTFAKVLKKPLKNAYRKSKVASIKNYGAYNYKETASDTTVKTNQYILPAVSPINSGYSSYNTYSKSTDTAIQVGAFRKYSGAKLYKKRYNALSNKYRVTIKTGKKNNKPIHRVRIEGFENKAEAKKIIYSYGIKNAFLVRK